MNWLSFYCLKKKALIFFHTVNISTAVLPRWLQAAVPTGGVCMGWMMRNSWHQLGRSLWVAQDIGPPAEKDADWCYGFGTSPWGSLASSALLSLSYWERKLRRRIHTTDAKSHICLLSPRKPCPSHRGPSAVPSPEFHRSFSARFYLPCPKNNTMSPLITSRWAESQL